LIPGCNLASSRDGLKRCDNLQHGVKGDSQGFNLGGLVRVDEESDSILNYPLRQGESGSPIGGLCCGS